MHTNSEESMITAKRQWLFALVTSAALIALGAGMMAIGDNGSALLALGTILGAFNSYQYYQRSQQVAEAQVPATLLNKASS